MCRHFIEPFALVEVQVLVNLVTANRIVPHLLAGADAALLQAPVNVLRLSLHPKGFAPNPQPDTVARPPLRAPAPENHRHGCPCAG